MFLWNWRCIVCMYQNYTTCNSLLIHKGSLNRICFGQKCNVLKFKYPAELQYPDKRDSPYQGLSAHWSALKVPWPSPYGTHSVLPGSWTLLCMCCFENRLCSLFKNLKMRNEWHCHPVLKEFLTLIFRCEKLEKGLKYLLQQSCWKNDYRDPFGSALYQEGLWALGSGTPLGHLVSCLLDDFMQVFSLWT